MGDSLVKCSFLQRRSRLRGSGNSQRPSVITLTASATLIQALAKRRNKDHTSGVRKEAPIYDGVGLQQKQEAPDARLCDGGVSSHNPGAAVQLANNGHAIVSSGAAVTVAHTAKQREFRGLVRRPRLQGTGRRAWLQSSTLVIKLPPRPARQLPKPPEPEPEPEQQPRLEQQPVPEQEPQRQLCSGASLPCAAGSGSTEYQAAHGFLPEAAHAVGVQLVQLMQWRLELRSREEARRLQHQQHLHPSRTPAPTKGFTAVAPTPGPSIAAASSDSAPTRTPSLYRSSAFTPDQRQTRVLSPLPHETPIEGIPERFTIQKPLLPGAASRGGRGEENTDPATSSESGLTPIEGVPERLFKRRRTSLLRELPWGIGGAAGLAWRSPAARTPPMGAFPNAHPGGPSPDAPLPLGDVSASVADDDGATQGAIDEAATGFITAFAHVVAPTALAAASSHGVAGDGADLMTLQHAADFTAGVIAPTDNDAEDPAADPADEMTAAEVAAAAVAAARRLQSLIRHPSPQSYGPSPPLAPSTRGGASTSGDLSSGSSGNTPAVVKLHNLGEAVVDAVNRAAAAIRGNRSCQSARAQLPPRPPSGGNRRATPEGREDSIAQALPPSRGRRMSGASEGLESLEGLIHRPPADSLLFPSRTPSPMCGFGWPSAQRKTGPAVATETTPAATLTSEETPDSLVGACIPMAGPSAVAGSTASPYDATHSAGGFQGFQANAASVRADGTPFGSVATAAHGNRDAGSSDDDAGAPMDVDRDVHASGGSETGGDSDVDGDVGPGSDTGVRRTLDCAAGVGDVDDSHDKDASDDSEDEEADGAEAEGNDDAPADVVEVVASGSEDEADEDSESEETDVPGAAQVSDILVSESEEEEEEEQQHDERTAAKGEREEEEAVEEAGRPADSRVAAEESEETDADLDDEAGPSPDAVGAAQHRPASSAERSADTHSEPANMDGGDMLPPPDDEDGYRPGQGAIPPDSILRGDVDRMDSDDEDQVRRDVRALPDEPATGGRGLRSSDAKERSQNVSGRTAPGQQAASGSAAAAATAAIAARVEEAMRRGRGARATEGHEHERRLVSNRKSLADIGLVVGEEGTRRSTRNRVRPLEYWRGEGKNYGRAHNSLPTVTSIKMRTPEPQWPLPSGKVEKAKRKARTKLAAAEAEAAGG